MLKFVVVLSFVACALAGTIPEGMVSLSDDLGGRIVGGTPTTITSFPWQVSIQRYGSHTCGGTIYNSRIIVTAAHCLQSVSASVLRIRAGSSYWNSGGVVISVSAFRNHEGYNSDTQVNDIAIMKLVSPLSFNSSIRSIGLATSTPDNGASASVSGWGKLKFGVNTLPSQLQFIDVSIIDRVTCASRAYGYRSAIKPGMFCAAASGKDSCQGDSGGPLVSGGVLVGVVSWGNGCALAKYPGVYADVANYHSWLVKIANSI